MNAEKGNEVPLEPQLKDGKDKGCRDGSRQPEEGG